MLFNSLQSASFVALVVVVYWRLPGRARQILLLAASYLFYASFDWRFLGLLGLITLVDYVVALRIAASTAPRTRRRWLLLALVTNLGVLGAFKYVDFFMAGAVELLTGIGLQANTPALALLLPVGISFYVFQSVAYCVDVHRGRLQPERDPVVFATFIAFFPQLLAGPIERGERLLPQLREHRDRPRPGDIASGLDLILLGLVRKVVIADTLAPAVTMAFTEEREFFGVTYGVQHSWITLAAGAFAFTAQLYGDFAGYSTMARGIARLFGIDLSVNFQRPLWSSSPGELWRRWHITLMAWFRDYVYFPLWSSTVLARAFPRRESRAVLATFAVFVLAGLWHGAEGRWLLWGVLTGVLVGSEVWWKGRAAARRRSASRREVSVRRTIAATLTLLVFVALAVPVGSVDLAQTMSVWGGVLSLQSGVVLREVVVLAAFGWLVLLLTDRHEVRLERIERWRQDRGGGSAPGGTTSSPPLGDVQWAMRSTAMVVGLLIFSGGSTEPFFYFRF